jgi:hypothetical protein
MTRDFVTVATFSVLPEAEAARLRLETEGIPAIITDAEIVNMDWLLGNAVGYIKLQVPPERAAAALALLDQVAAERRERIARREEDPLAAEEATCLSCGAEMAEEADHCAVCGWTWEHEPEE